MNLKSKCSATNQKMDFYSQNKGKQYTEFMIYPSLPFDPLFDPLSHLRFIQKESKNYEVVGNALIYFKAFDQLPEETLIEMARNLEGQEDFYVVKGKYNSNGIGNSTESKPMSLPVLLLNLDVPTLQKIWTPFFLQTPVQKVNYLGATLHLGRLEQAHNVLLDFNGADCEFLNRLLQRTIDSWAYYCPQPHEKRLYFEIFDLIKQQAQTVKKPNNWHKDCLNYLKISATSDNPVAYHYLSGQIKKDISSEHEICFHTSIASNQAKMMTYFFEQGYNLTLDLVESKQDVKKVYYTADFTRNEIEQWLIDSHDWNATEQQVISHWVEQCSLFPIVQHSIQEALSFALEKHPNSMNSTLLKVMLEQSLLQSQTPTIQHCRKSPRL